MKAIVCAAILTQVGMAGVRGLSPRDVVVVGVPKARLQSLCLELATKGRVEVGRDWRMRLLPPKVKTRKAKSR